MPVVLLERRNSREALKLSEDGTAWIVRLVERRGRHARERLHFSSSTTLIETDGLKFTEGVATPVADEVEMTFTPFQIRTWKIVG